MEKKAQNKIVYAIAVTILVTLAIQVYWNSKNYRANRVQLVNDVQAALDNSIDFYYTDLAKSSMKTITKKEEVITPLSKGRNLQSVIDSIIHSKIREAGKQLKGDSVKLFTIQDDAPVEISGPAAALLPGQPGGFSQAGALATKIVISLSNEEVDFKKLSAILNRELQKRRFDFKYAILHSKNGKTLNSYRTGKERFPLSVQSKSAYLPETSIVTLQFQDITALALKESLVGIVLSFLLSASIIASLLYLLKIINRQKQVALIKNDFISNISHELKTPITISLSANEAIQRFNSAGAIEKTEKYIDISNEQLHKLNLMVEKILETATLDTDQLFLKKEATNLTELLKNTLEKQQMNTAKELRFYAPDTVINAPVDRFHFENVIANIIENAIKYGGGTIETAIAQTPYTIAITISDNGTPIEKSQREKIFDKFYRIPKNNIHDVKGFGIGLYYARKIVEKHSGLLEIVPDPHKTIFKITLPCLIK